MSVRHDEDKELAIPGVSLVYSTHINIYECTKDIFCCQGINYFANKKFITNKFVDSV